MVHGNSFAYIRKKSNVSYISQTHVTWLNQWFKSDIDREYWTIFSIKQLQYDELLLGNKIYVCLVLNGLREKQVGKTSIKLPNKAFSTHSPTYTSVVILFLITHYSSLCALFASMILRVIKIISLFRNVYWYRRKACEKITVIS